MQNYTKVWFSNEIKAAASHSGLHSLFRIPNHNFAFVKIPLTNTIYYINITTDIAYRLFTIAERKGWAQEAYAYNSLVIAWPDVQAKAAELAAQLRIGGEQLSFDIGGI